MSLIPETVYYPMQKFKNVIITLMLTTVIVLNYKLRMECNTNTHLSQTFKKLDIPHLQSCSFTHHDYFRYIILQHSRRSQFCSSSGFLYDLMDGLNLPTHKTLQVLLDNVNVLYDNIRSAICDQDFNILITANLHNNEEVLSNWLYQLSLFINHIGPSRITISIHESASTDRTKQYLKQASDLFDNLNVEYYISTSPEHKSGQMHRIDFLAKQRNKALFPMLTANHTHILFLNDILYCHSDLLELLLQSLLNSADITTGMDYDMPFISPSFYDVWVARDIQGIPLTKNPFDYVTNHSTTLINIQEGIPAQAMCTWNGAALLNAKPFLEFSLYFRRGSNRNNTLFESGECSASEITTLCMDFIRNGHDKFLIIPRVKVFTSNLVGV
eukprot:NODE_102_length_20354_cov_0.272018.p3 type:complete len:385 gc:universal NODE_102_length_20354_cov_0.272018:9057-10211(+)